MTLLKPYHLETKYINLENQIIFFSPSENGFACVCVWLLDPTVFNHSIIRQQILFWAILWKTLQCDWCQNPGAIVDNDNERDKTTLNIQKLTDTH